jgi:ribose transport system permease protein
VGRPASFVREEAVLTTAPPVAATKRRAALSEILRRKEVSVLVALVVLCVVITALSPFFLRMSNIFNVLRQFSLIGILAVGEALVIITGGIDLSVGSVVGLCGVMTAVFARAELPTPVVFLASMAFGTAVGAVNGLLVTRLAINPFIVTLGMLSVARGAALLITGGLPISNESPITWLGGGHVGPVPVPVILMFLVAAAGQIYASRTTAGRNVFAVGDNTRAAFLSGIRVGRVKASVFMITGALCALCGIALSGTLNSAEPTAGAGYELDVIAAVVIGGASLAGGEGSIVGVIIGAALMGVLRNGFVLLGISAYWQVVSIGVVIISAVALDSVKTRGRSS